VQGFNCCSDTAIGFHQVTPEQMYLYEYLIYELNPYGLESIRAELQSKPDAPPDADLAVILYYKSCY
jgi:glycoprotein-N-acetylgalactosamine 3-beta-galactosyltransferase